MNQKDNQVFEEKIITINDIQTFVRIKGKGDPFLILHGWGGNADSWKKVQDILAQDFCVIVFDFPGFGKSWPPKKIWDAESYVEFVFALLNKLNINQNFYLLGHSFGGMIALKIAAIHPEKIKKLILVSPAIFRSSNRLIKYLILINSKIVRLFFGWIPGFKFLRKVFYKYFLGKTDYIEAQGIMEKIFKRIISTKIPQFVFKMVDVPTIIIWGKKDKVTLPKYGKKLQKLLPLAELVYIQSAHAPNITHPQMLAEIIKAKAKE